MKESRRKNPSAVKLGRRGAQARNRKLSPQRRREIAVHAINARWKRLQKGIREAVSLEKR